MSHADTCYADRAWHGAVVVQANSRIARDTYRLRVHAPEIAPRIVPGQFVMIRLPDREDPLLGRPLAYYDTVLDEHGQPVGLDIVYLVVGRMTSRLARVRPGHELMVWGPLGNGFPVEPAEHLAIVAGGIGQTPFLSLAKECLGLAEYGPSPRRWPRRPRITFCYGARSREYLACLSDFERIGVDVRFSTDDGSAGHHGRVTELLAELIASGAPPSHIVCCGPEPMMAATAKLAQQAQIPCRVSLETPMACGLGICFSCVARVRDETGSWDYRRTCVEGPVFDAAVIEF